MHRAASRGGGRIVSSHTERAVISPRRLTRFRAAVSRCCGRAAITSPCVRVRATLSRPLGYTTRLTLPPSHRETINTFSCVFTVVHGTNTGLCFFALIYSPKRRRRVMACLVHIEEATDLSGHEFQATTWLVYTCPCPGHRGYRNTSVATYM